MPPAPASIVGDAAVQAQARQTPALIAALIITPLMAAFQWATSVAAQISPPPAVTRVVKDAYIYYVPAGVRDYALGAAHVAQKMIADMSGSANARPRTRSRTATAPPEPLFPSTTAESITPASLPALCAAATHSVHLLARAFLALPSSQSRIESGELPHAVASVCAHALVRHGAGTRDNSRALHALVEMLDVDTQDVERFAVGHILAHALQAADRALDAGDGDAGAVLAARTAVRGAIDLPLWLLPESGAETDALAQLERDAAHAAAKLAAATRRVVYGDESTNQDADRAFTWRARVPAPGDAFDAQWMDADVAPGAEDAVVGDEARARVAFAASAGVARFREISGNEERWEVRDVLVRAKVLAWSPNWGGMEVGEDEHAVAERAAKEVIKGGKVVEPAAMVQQHEGGGMTVAAEE